MGNQEQQNEALIGGSGLNGGLAAELRDLLDAAEAIHMVLQERWGDANGSTVDAKSIVEYFKKAANSNLTSGALTAPETE